MGFYRKKSQPKVSDSLVKSKSSQEIDIRNSDNNGKRGEVIIHQPPWKVPTIHDKFPNLVGQTQNDQNFNLYEYKGSSWAVIFTQPNNFGPVCTSEFVELLKLKREFDSNNIKVVGFSTNVSDAQAKWLKDVEAIANGYVPYNGTIETAPPTQSTIKVDFPIYSDLTLEMAVELGILDCDTADDEGLPVTTRTMHVLSPDNHIALINHYPPTVGRNWRELLRSITALQLVEKSRELIHIPSHWEPGNKVLVDPNLSDNECDEIFGIGRWDRMTLPSDVCQEVGSFIQGPGGVRIGEKEIGITGSIKLPRHYMRYTEII